MNHSQQNFAPNSVLIRDRIINLWQKGFSYSAIVRFINSNGANISQNTVWHTIQSNNYQQTNKTIHSFNGRPRTQGPQPWQIQYPSSFSQNFSEDDWPPNRRSSIPNSRNLTNYNSQNNRKSWPMQNVQNNQSVQPKPLQNNQTLQSHLEVEIKIEPEEHPVNT